MTNFIVSAAGTLTIVIDAKPYTIAPDHPNYDKIKSALKTGDSQLIIELVDIARSVEDYVEGDAEVKDGVVYYEGDAIHNTLTERILDMMAYGFPFKPMFKFVNNLMKNPSKRATEELYDFLMHKNLPITDDGCFLAYKRVNADWTDLYSNAIDNSIGQIVKMARRKVDDNREMGCSDGLHVGALEYVEGYGSGGHVLVVKINPEHVVSVPSDHDCTKVRCCEYEVLSEFKGELKKPVYSPDGSEYDPSAGEDNYDPDPDNVDDYDYDETDEDDGRVEVDHDAPSQGWRGWLKNAVGASKTAPDAPEKDVDDHPLDRPEDPVQDSPKENQPSSLNEQAKLYSDSLGLGNHIPLDSPAASETKDASEETTSDDKGDHNFGFDPNYDRK
jgi:hypothetical protein